MADPQPIYLDHNATTPLDPRVLHAMLPFFTDLFANAASRQHAAGRAAARAVALARRQLAQLIAADEREIIFTSGATESNNLALKGALAYLAEHGSTARHILTTSIEHNSVREVCRRLAEHGYQITSVDPSPTGLVTADAVAAALRPDTALVSVMWANNEVGSINDLPAIGRLCKERRILLHTDATQLVGKLPVDVNAASVDLLSCSAHKMYGPKGVGALFVRRKSPRVRLLPLIDGGGHEGGWRSGTLNVPGIVGFGAAAALCLAEMHADAARLAPLRDQLEFLLLARFPQAFVNAASAPRLPHTTSITLPGIDAERLIAALPDLAISSGAACTTASLHSSHVLRRLGLSEPHARASLRFGLGRSTSPDHIPLAVDRIARAIQSIDFSAPACQPSL